MKSTSWYASARAEEVISARARTGERDRSATINRALDRYAEICRREIPGLSEAEWRLVTEATGGTLHEPASHCAYVPASIADAIRLDGLAGKWGVDAPALLEKLEALSYAQRVALVDAVERPEEKK